MLLEFSVGNYRSFKDLVKLSMVATSLASNDESLDLENVMQFENSPDLLKSAVVYGPNASGKSNLIWAIGFMKNLVRNSSKEGQAEEEIPTEYFRLSTETENQPSIFELVFKCREKRFRYGFEVDKTRVCREWLYHVPNKREAMLFERDGDKFDISGVFNEGRGLESKTRNNALFLSVNAQFNGPISTAILGWFSRLNVLSGIQELPYRSFTTDTMADSGDKDKVVAFVKDLDLGIVDIEIEKTPFRDEDLPSRLPKKIAKMFRELVSETTTISTIHAKYGPDGTVSGFEKFRLDEHESDGTKKAFALSGPIIDTLASGKILVIDELDTRLHPHITKSIISLFNSRKSNRNNAQLIFATHDTNLLKGDLFRRDQVWFTEKTETGCSDLFSLAEFPVRKDSPFEKEYLSGKYGAVPYVRDIEQTFSNIYGSKE